MRRATAASALVLLFCTACGDGQKPGRAEKQDGDAAATKAVGQVAERIGAEATRALTDPSAPVEIIADEAVLQRIIANDKTLTSADLDHLYVSASGTQYVRDFEALSNLPPAGTIQFRSKDGRYFGALQKRQGDFQGRHIVRYEAAVWQDPTREMAEGMAKSKGITSDTGLACYRRVAAYTENKPPPGYKPEDDPAAMNDPRWQVFEDLGPVVQKQGDLRKKGVFCSGPGIKSEG